MNETKWRGYFRQAKNGAVIQTEAANSFDESTKWLDLCRLLMPENDHWLQPDGTEPALKAGTGAIGWRVHYRCTDDLSNKERHYFADRDKAQERADSENAQRPRLIHWIQPEPNPELRWRIWGIGADGHRFDTHYLESRELADRLAKQWSTPNVHYFANPEVYRVNTEEPKPEPIPEIRAGSQYVIHGRTCMIEETSERNLQPGRVELKVRTSFDQKPAPLKLYERRWKFSIIRAGGYPFPFKCEFGDGNRLCQVIRSNLISPCISEAERLNGMDPQQADAEIDAIYAGQK